MGLSVFVATGFEGDGELGFLVGLLLSFLPDWLACAPLCGLPPAWSTVLASRPIHHMVPATAAMIAMTTGTTTRARLRGFSSSSS